MTNTPTYSVLLEVDKDSQTNLKYNNYSHYGSILREIKERKKERERKEIHWQRLKKQIRKQEGTLISNNI